MQIHCTAGTTTTNMVTDLPGYGMVWFHPNGITNILSLARVKAKYQVTYDSDGGNAFVVHRPGTGEQCFVQSPGGLYYFDVSTCKDSMVLVTTVANNKSKYSDDYARAVLARKL